MIERNWQELVRPHGIEIQLTKTATTIIAEPLERGFGFTLGNALRRPLLSSLEDAPVTAVRIDGASAAPPAHSGSGTGAILLHPINA